MKLMTIVGARPQFVKAGVVSKAIKTAGKIEEIVVHTGQHFDANMSDIFFSELGLPRPDYKLDIHGGTHGQMTGRMLIEIEQLLLQVKPDRVMVYGDTNSTLAGSLAACKLHIPIAHVEAGLRSFNMRMPEEINRIMTDKVSDMLFCPTDTAVENLAREGILNGAVHVLQTGDVMEDSARLFESVARVPQEVAGMQNFVLATLHRAENTDDLNRLSEIIKALNQVHQEVMPVVLPLHPRTSQAIKAAGLQLNVCVIEPVGYLDMLGLLKTCALVLTDSGGVQKESFFFRKPCVTMRDQTEWVELLTVGANRLVGANSQEIVAAVRQDLGHTITDENELYGGGKAAERIATHLFVDR